MKLRDFDEKSSGKRSDRDSLSFDTMFGSLIEALPRGLASPSGVDRARRIARRLPPATAALFEFTPSGPAAGLDISIRVDERDETRAIVEGVHDSLVLPAPCRADADWRRAAAFAAAWRAPNGPLAGRVETAWLEFDDVDTEDEASAPRPMLYVSHPRTGAAREAGPQNWVCDALAPLLVDSGDLTALVATLRPWLANPERIRFRHLGALWARDARGVRLCLTVPLAGLGVWLATTTRLPQAARAAAVVSAVAGDESATTVLHLDLTPDIGPRLGFELQPAEGRRWPDMLERLARFSGADATRLLQALAWTDIPPELKPKGALMRYVSGVSRVLEAGDAGLTLRLLNHVKLIFDHDGRASPKIYLSALRLAKRDAAAPGDSRARPPGQ